MQSGNESSYLVVIWSLAIGVFLCAVYDIFRITRLRKKQNAVTLFVFDLLFCIIATCSFLLLFFNLTYGRVRVYSFVFALIGFLIWRSTVSCLVIGIILRVIKIAEKLLNSIKMRVRSFVVLASRRIYTGYYCCNTANKAKSGFGLMKLKGKEKEYEQKKTCTHQPCD